MKHLPLLLISIFILSSCESEDESSQRICFNCKIFKNNEVTEREECEDSLIGESRGATGQRLEIELQRSGVIAECE